MGRVWRFSDNIDTDALAPGRFMHRPIEELAANCLIDLSPEFAAQAGQGDVIVAGRNFGMGSSREQAAQALKMRGLAGVVAESFAGIFYRNAINLGLPVFVILRPVFLSRPGRLISPFRDPPGLTSQLITLFS